MRLVSLYGFKTRSLRTEDFVRLEVSGDQRFCSIIRMGSSDRVNKPQIRSLLLGTSSETSLPRRMKPSGFRWLGHMGNTRLPYRAVFFFSRGGQQMTW